MRPLAAIPGLLLLGAVWLGPLPTLAHGSFLAHMAMHVSVVAVAAPLLALSIAGGRVDPTDRLPWLFGPIAASLLEFIVVWGWHLPRLHLAATRSAAVLVAEQASFLAVGTVLWLSCFGGNRSRTVARAATGAFGLFLTSMHMTLLGALLALAQRPLYAHADGPALGLTAMEDQQLGGIAMLLVGGASYLIGGVFLTARLLGSGAPASGAAANPPLPADRRGTERHAPLG